MEGDYESNVEATREDYFIEPAETGRLFRALLDMGLIRTTTDNCVFGALKGALDGGIDILHSHKRFVGFNKDGKQLDAEVHRSCYFGGKQLQMEDEPEKYQAHFSEYLKRGITADSMEASYKKVHAAIRADPSALKSTKEAPKEHKRYYFALTSLLSTYLEKQSLIGANITLSSKGKYKMVNFCE